MINYEKLMALEPSVYMKMTNSKGQEIELVEHPIDGDMSDILCVCHELKLAARSGFFDTIDMTADHKEYEPSFQDGKFFIGEFEH